MLLGAESMAFRGEKGCFCNETIAQYSKNMYNRLSMSYISLHTENRIKSRQRNKATKKTTYLLQMYGNM